MGRQIIRLTESDLHKIVKESVRRALREMNSNERFAALEGVPTEELQARYEELADKLREFKKNGEIGTPEYIEAAQERQAIKERLGLSTRLNVGAYWSDEENKKREEAGLVDLHPWRKFQKEIEQGKKQINKDEKEKQGAPENNIDDIMMGA